jgi:hypothetical protein
MKKLMVLLLLFSSLFFAACPLDTGGGGGGTDGNNNETANGGIGNGSNNNGTGNGGGTGGENARVVFDNKAGQCPVSVYETNERSENTKIAEVSAGAVSEVIPWRANADGYTFYLAYSVFIEDIPVTYIPRPGPDQLLCRIDANILNTIKLPPLSGTLDSTDTRLSGEAYIVLQNTSYSSCYLLRGSRIITPDNVSDSHIVNSSEKALYHFSAPGAAAEYKLFANGKNIDFSGVDGDFEGGRIYTFVFSGANDAEADLSLKSDTAIVLANVSLAQGANKSFSFTTWQDKKTDAETGETVAGDNAIVFYANSAKLTGSYWQHPRGDFDYNGQILESYFSEQNNGMVIWTLRSERRGYLLEIQADQTLQVSKAVSGASPHPFYKQ